MGAVKSREQELVDICFSLVSTATDPQYQSHFNSLTQEQKMEWVAKQLRDCGFPTSPRGASWGVLDEACRDITLTTM